MIRKSLVVTGLSVVLLLTAQALPVAAKDQPQWLRQATPAQRSEVMIKVRDIGFRSGLTDNTIIALITLADGPAGASPSDRIANAASLIEGGRHIRKILVDQLQQFNYRQDKVVVAGLGKVKRAFDDGRFDKALANLDDLVPVDGRPSPVPDPAWSTLVQVRMLLCTLTGDYDKAISDLQQARRVRADADRPTRYRLASLEAGTWYNKGRGGDREALLRSIQVVTNEVLPLAPRDTAPQDWAATQMALCIGWGVLGKDEEGTESLDRAISACELALEVIKREGQLFVWGQLQSSLATAWAARMERHDDIEAQKHDAARALEHFRLAHEAFGPDKHPSDAYVVEGIAELEGWQKDNP